VGKLTVARHVARTLGARLLDNHTLHDVAIRLCDRGTPEYWDLYYQIRAVAYGRVRALPAGTVLVMTNALLGMIGATRRRGRRSNSLPQIARRGLSPSRSSVRSKRTSAASVRMSGVIESWSTRHRSSNGVPSSRC
jgi:hypothetical protein